MSIHNWYQRHFCGSAGISNLLIIAVPMIITQAADTVMMFCDRYFLSYLGKAHMSASMSGCVSLFFLLSLWLGINGYVNVLVAQHYGAKQENKCSIAVTQGLILSILAYPIILLCIPLVEYSFVLSEPHPHQLMLQKEYFFILTLASPLPLFRTVLSGFFSGISKTKIVMIANCAGMLLNIPLTYAMVFGEWGFSALGVAGAAYGTVIGELLSFLILASIYLTYHKSFHIRSSLVFDRSMFGKLVRYGLPYGVEFFVVWTLFGIVIQQFHHYSLDVAAAMTTVFNWELVVLLPMMGLSIATTSLVGQQLGANDIREAKRALSSSLKVVLIYSLIIMGLFSFYFEELVGIFIPRNIASQASEAFTLATMILRIAPFYLTAEALTKSINGALQGAGDTLWPMKATMVIWGFMIPVVVICIRVYELAPLYSWMIFIITPILTFAAMILRYRSEKWKRFRLVSTE